MKLYFMKQKALDYMRANIGVLYINYYRESTNQWILDLFDYDPFELFIEIPDFTLSPITNKKGEVDLENCKILYSKLMQISESQASDERLWAGLCNSTFYEYLINRWDYKNLELKNPKNDASTVLSRFFFRGGTRAGFFRNTLSKCWWVGHATYQSDLKNKFELLDALGAEDFSSKVSDFFYSNTFASNPTIMRGVCKAWKLFKDRKMKVTVREHFRPALQYLNALGGGMLLDILTEDEIMTVFFNYVYKLYSGEEGDMVIDEIQDELETEESSFISEDIQQLREKNQSEVYVAKEESKTEEHRVVIGTKSGDEKESKLISKIMPPPESVTYGCTVTVLKGGITEIDYNIPLEGQEKFYIQKLLIGKRVNDEFFCSGNKYLVKDIRW